MQTRSRATRLLTAAALTGLMAGAAAVVTGCQNSNPSGAGVSASSGSGAANAQLAKHDCKGMNSCKGQGGCKAGDNGCKGMNSCKGKGGCNTAHPM